MEQGIPSVFEHVRSNQRFTGKLSIRSLDGGFNSTIAKLLLANHGYSDRQQIEHSEKVSDSGDNDW